MRKPHRLIGREAGARKLAKKIVADNWPPVPPQDADLLTLLVYVLGRARNVSSALFPGSDGRMIGMKVHKNFEC